MIIYIPRLSSPFSFSICPCFSLKWRIVLDWKKPSRIDNSIYQNNLQTIELILKHDFNKSVGKKGRKRNSFFSRPSFVLQSFKSRLSMFDLSSSIFKLLLLWIFSRFWSFSFVCACWIFSQIGEGHMIY